MTLLLKSLILAYRWLISPFLHWLGGPGSGCRFEPTCSVYLWQAIEQYGPWKGLLLGVKRIAKCHPWGGMGYDPVPSKISKNT